MINNKNIKSHPKQDITNWEMYIYSIFTGIALKVFNITDFSWLSINIANWLIGIGGIMFAIDSLNKAKPYKQLFENANLIVNEQVPNFIKKRKSSYGYDLIFSLPPGLSSEQINKKKVEIEEYLNANVEISVKKRKLIIQAFTERLQDIYNYEFIKTKNPCEFPIGYAHTNRIITVDLEKVTHMLIAGETGSGKSTLLRSIITNLILNNKNNKISLHLIDLKNGAEFSVFRKCRVVKTFSRTVDEAEGTLHNLLDEADKRHDMFYLTNTVNIQEYNKLKNIRRLRHEIVIIDEFADLQNEKSSIAALETLAAKARAAGIHLIISTQRPDMKVLNGRIKANIPCTIGLKTMNSTNSRIIIDEDGLEKLKGKGHGILKYIDKTEFQGMYLTVREARELIRHTYVEKPMPKEEVMEPVGQVESFDFLKVLAGGKE